jgi:hypothetical protein
MSENSNQAEIGSSATTESHKTTPPKLKKQITYAEGLAEREDSGSETGANFPTAQLNRTNSFSLQEEHEHHSKNSERNLNHHHLQNHQEGNQQEKDQNQCFQLHRSDEVENLADEDLLLTDDLGKSSLELFASKAHLKRTLELENLNEINND